MRRASPKESGPSPQRGTRSLDRRRRGAPVRGRRASGAVHDPRDAHVVRV